MTVDFTPNLLAFVALWAFFPVSLALFHYLRPSLAASVTVVGGVAVLPEMVVLGDLPVLPPADKSFVIAVSLLVGGLIYCRPAFVAEGRGRLFIAVAFAMLVACVGTFVTNRDGQVFGALALPPLRMVDAPHMFFRDAFRLLVPFFAARALFRTPGRIRDLAWVVVVTALIYTPLMLFEIRMSPQLHNWVYGFTQHAFIQSVRGDLYRPLGFMENGLAMTLFLAAAAVLAGALGRAKIPVLKVTPWVWAALLSFVLVLCRSLGSIIYALVSLVVVLLTKGKLARRVAAGLAVTVFAFPVLRAADVFPTEWLVSAAARYDEDRASSLQFRFDNEDLLVERALHRPVFGWGSYGRPRVFDADGVDVTITDGWWVIRLGERGAVGFMLAFGLLLAPVLVAYRRLPRLGHPRVRVLYESLTLLVAIHGLDLLPNGLFSLLTYFFAGALSGALRVVPASGASRRSP